MSIDINGFLNHFTIEMTNLILDLARYDKTPFYVDVGKIMEEAISENFFREGAYFDTKWKDIAESTKKARMKLSGKGKWPGKILDVTGVLKRFDFTADRVGVTWGPVADAFYSIYVHFGTKFMPARPIQPEKLPEDILPLISNAYVRWYNAVVLSG